MTQSFWFGVVIIPTPVLFLLSLFLFGSTSLFWLVWCRHLRRAPPASPTDPPQVVEVVKQRKEVYQDAEGIALIGPEWTWLQDQPVSYHCPHCSDPEPLTLRLFQSAESQRIVLIGRHHCRSRLIDTGAWITAQGGKE